MKRRQRHLWQVTLDCKHQMADHVEVAAGGEHSMENLQTLCTVCHKTKTAEFASMRAGRILNHQLFQ